MYTGIEFRDKKVHYSRCFIIFCYFLAKMTSELESKQSADKIIECLKLWVALLKEKAFCRRDVGLKLIQ